MVESSSRVNIGKGKSVFDKKGMGEIFGSKDVRTVKSTNHLTDSYRL